MHPEDSSVKMEEVVLANDSPSLVAVEDSETGSVCYLLTEEEDMMTVNLSLSSSATLLIAGGEPGEESRESSINKDTTSLFNKGDNGDGESAGLDSNDSDCWEVVLVSKMKGSPELMLEEDTETNKSIKEEIIDALLFSRSINDEDAKAVDEREEAAAYESDSTCAFISCDNSSSSLSMCLLLGSNGGDFTSDNDAAMMSNEDDDDDELSMEIPELVKQLCDEVATRIERENELANEDEECEMIVASVLQRLTDKDDEDEIDGLSNFHLHSVGQMLLRDEKEALVAQLRHVRVENSELAAENERLSLEVNEMKAVFFDRQRLFDEKSHLEKKMGDLIWENAGLHARLQSQQQGEVRVAKQTADLNRTLLEADQEVRRLATQQQHLQHFIEALLATLASLGFTAVTDPNGSRIPLEPVSSLVLKLEPKVDEVTVTPATAKKPRRNRPSDKWYKAMLAAQQETIHRLQEEVHILEATQGNQSESANMLHQLQKALHTEMERNRVLERQTQHLTWLLEETSDEAAKSKVNKQQCRDEARPQQTTDGSSDYARLGARPKIPHGRRCASWLACSSEEAEGDAGMALTTTAPRTPSCTSEHLQPGDADCCPYCGETFSCSAGLPAREEHLRMHMYSEL